MTIVLEIPHLIASGSPFPETLTNDENETVAVTLTMKVGGVPRNFSVDGSVVGLAPVVQVGPLTTRNGTISNWGTAASGTAVELTAAPGNAGTGIVT